MSQPAIVGGEERIKLPEGLPPAPLVEFDAEHLHEAQQRLKARKAPIQNSRPLFFILVSFFFVLFSHRTFFGKVVLKKNSMKGEA